MRREEELERKFRQIEADISRLQSRTDEQPVRYAKPTGADGGGQYGVVRFWAVDERPKVNVTILTPKARTGNITGISQSQETVITVDTDHGILAADAVSISGVTGMTEINGLSGSVLSASETTITVDIDSSSFTAYTGSGVWALASIRDLFLEADTTVALATDGNIPAKSYDAFKFVGDDETYPLKLPLGVVPLPIFPIAGVRTIMHHSKIYYGKKIPAGMPITEGIIVNGKGEMQFAN